MTVDDNHDDNHDDNYDDNFDDKFDDGYLVHRVVLSPEFPRALCEAQPIV